MKKCIALSFFVSLLSLLIGSCSANEAAAPMPTTTRSIIPTEIPVQSAATEALISPTTTLALPTCTPSPTAIQEPRGYILSELPVIDAENAERIAELMRWQDRSAVYSVAVNPQGDWIGWGNHEGQVSLIQVSGKISPSSPEQKRINWIAHSLRINRLAFSPQGSLLATASEDYTAKLWNPTDGQLIKVFKGYEDGIAAIAFSADEKWLAVSSYDFKVHLWKAKEEGAARDFSTKNVFAQGLAFSPDGKLLAVSANEWKARLFSIQIWQVINGKLIHSVRGFEERLNGLAFSPDGTWLAFGSGDDITPQQVRAVRLIQVSSAKLAQSFSGHQGAVGQVVFSPSQPLLASASSDGTVRVWSVPDGALLAALEHNSRVNDVAFAPDGNYLLSAAQDGTVRLWGIDPKIQ